VLDLAISLVPHFRKVHLLAPSAAGVADDEEWDGVHIRRFRYAWPAFLQQVCYRYGLVQNLRRNPLLFSLLPFFYAAQVRAVARLCREFPVQVINSHWFALQGMAAARVTRKLPIRHVAHSHGADVDLFYRLPGGLGRRIIESMLGGRTTIVCESSYVRERLDRLIGHSSEAAISCMGVKVSAFAGLPPVSGAGSTLLFVGRLVEKKGVEYLLAAMPEVKRQIPDVKLRIVGSGDLESTLRRQAATLALTPDTVEFCGAQPHAAIPELVGRSAVLVVPSVVDSRGEADGMPTVLLEAMAAGRRIVASRVDGVPDVVRDGENGWLCPPREPAALAGKLVAALQSTDDRILAEARKTASYYDWPALGRRYAEWLS
jgi:glycosyltransferase involved in cell wall biosynthesis